MAASITDVKLSPDLSYADVSVSAISGVEGAIKFLQGKKGEMRHTIAQQVQAHAVPIIRFHVDESGAKADKLDRLIDSL
jgi:ribosome-binding factor A